MDRDAIITRLEEAGVEVSQIYGEEYPSLVIDCRDTAIEDEDLVLISKLPGVTYLNLGGCAITDKGALHLQFLSELESLALNDSTVTGRCLLVVEFLPCLEYLSAVGLHNIKAGFSGLLGSRSIRSVDLSRSDVSSDMLEPLVDIPSIEDVDLTQTSIRRASILSLDMSDSGRPTRDIIIRYGQSGRLIIIERLKSA